MSSEVEQQKNWTPEEDRLINLKENLERAGHAFKTMGVAAQNAMRAIAGLPPLRPPGTVKTVLVPGQLRRIEPVPRRKQRRR